MAHRQDTDGENPGSAKWVFCADSRIAQKDLADGSVSLVLTDPPYGIDGMDEAWDHGKLNGRVKPGVVGGLPAGMKFSRSQGPRLYDFLAPVAAEWARVLKPGGFVLCFSQARLTHHVAMAIEDAGFEIRDLLAWQYEGQAKAFSQEHFVRKRADLSESEKADIIERLGGRKTPQLKPQMETIALGQLPRDGAYWENWVKHGVGLIDASDPFIQPDKFPGQIIPARKERRRFNHMTVKPVPLLRHLIRLFSKEGEDSIILDPFAGTGSTGVAARLEGRGFIGFEKDARMAKMADARVDTESVELKGLMIA